MGKVISLVSLKGGVGKTTLATSLASDLAIRYGKKVLLVDANYSAPNLGIHMDILCPKHTIHDVLNGSKISSAIHSRYGVDVIPGNFMFNRTISPLKLRAKLSSARKLYDFIVIDSSPSLNDEFLSSVFASDESFLVTTPDYPTLSCSMKVAKLAKQHGARLGGIIVNRVSRPNLQVGLEEIQESIGVPVVSIIKEDSKVIDSLFSRVPMPIFSKNSGFTREIGKLSSSLVGEREKVSFLSKILNFRKTKDMNNREDLRKRFYTSIFVDENE